MISKTLDSIVVVSKPTKLEYIEGEKFDNTGLVVDARFLSKWSNGYEEYTVDNNVSYFVNTTSPLLTSITSWTVSYIVDGIKKEVEIPIVVKENSNVNNDNNDSKFSSEKVKIPKVAKVLSMKIIGGKKRLTISWKKDSSVAGYQVQISTKSNFKGAKTISIAKSKTKYTKKHLKAKKKYFVRVRAFKIYNDNGKSKKVYGKWCKKNKKIK